MAKVKNSLFMFQTPTEKSIIRTLLSIFVILSSNLVLNVACDKNDEMQIIRNRPSYHNLVIKTSLNSSDDDGSFPYFGVYRTIYQLKNDGELVRANNCDIPSAIDDFPGFIFPEESLLKGSIVFHFFAAIYFLSVLAIVCGHYFIPSVECICEDLHLSTDVAAATFMATATTMPEFFTNTISTFVTDSDLGIGAIIGSMLFNTLGVAGCAALAAAKPISVDWWPVSRDSLIFSINTIILVGFAFDGRIVWYESTTFTILLILYFVIMFQNKRISKHVRPFLERNLFCFTKKRIYALDHGTETTGTNGTIPTGNTDVEKSNGSLKVQTNGITNNSYVAAPDDHLGKMQEPPTADPEHIGEMPFHGHHPIVAPHVIDDEIEEEMSLWSLPQNCSKTMLFWWFYTWPIRLFTTCTIPNPITYRKLYPLTFIMCMIVLALNSYMVVWMVSVIGYAFNLPEAVMGFTFLAAGGCLPEAISAIIMARKGDGALGISNSLGSSSLAILFSLGFPWFLRAMVDLIKGNNSDVLIYNDGMEYTIMILLLAVVALYLILAVRSFQLSRLTGGALLCVYTVFVTLGILMNMGLIFSFVGNCNEPF